MAIEKIVRVAGPGLPLRGNDIDTDRIIPARFLRSVSFEGLERHLFEDDIAQTRSQGVTHPLTDARFENASILVVNAQLRVRVFEGTRAAGDPPQRVQRRGRRIVFGNLLRQLGGARDAVRDGESAGRGSAAAHHRRASFDRHHHRPRGTAASLWRGADRHCPALGRARVVSRRQLGRDGTPARSFRTG